MTYYHFAAVTDDGVPRLGYGDNREIVVGETLAVEGPVVLCQRGLHASRHALDALQYASPRAVLCLVELGGEIVHGDDKSAATERQCVAMLSEAETGALLRAFARWCALSVAHLWATPMPDTVRQYLETGDESLRAAARDATWAVARAAARDAARDAAWAAARDAARDAAWAAARDAASDAASAAARAAARAAAWNAASAAARDAVRAEQRAHLDEMAQAAFAEQTDSGAGINPKG